MVEALLRKGGFTGASRISRAKNPGFRSFDGKLNGYEDATIVVYETQFPEPKHIQKILAQYAKCLEKFYDVSVKDDYIAVRKKPEA